MKPKKQSSENSRSFGIFCFTINQNEQSQRDIGELWAKAYEGNLIDKVQDKSTSLYVLHLHRV